MRPERYDCDIVVVGAGPGGSMAAKYAALGGLDVILIEKRPEIGTPLRCAEGISRRWLPEIGLEPDASWISCEIDGVRLVSPSGHVFTTDERDENGIGRGFVLERHLFDKALAKQAAEAGARIMMRTACRDVIRDKDGKLIGIKADMMGEPIEIYAKCIVAADGFESQVARWAGIDTSLQMDEIDTCIQYRMTNIDIQERHCEFRVGSDAPGGYIWIFPKGNGIANVGLGVQAAMCGRGADPKYYLDRFIEKDERLRDGQILEVVGGAVSTSLPKGMVRDNIILVGDAARSINPLTGGGIHEACTSGKYAGNILAECGGDYSERRLSGYEDMWNSLLSGKFTRNLRIKECFTAMTDTQLDELISSIISSGARRMDLGNILKSVRSGNPDLFESLGL